jgi:hypothetical protein
MPVSAGYRSNFPPPSPPMQQQQPPQPIPYEPHPYQPPPESNYAPTAYNGNSNSKKKATRASQVRTQDPKSPTPLPPETSFSNNRFPQACDYCRQLKAKCDETKPCKTCREKGAECVYRESIPKPYVVLPLPLVNLDH